MDFATNKLILAFYGLLVIVACVVASNVFSIGRSIPIPVVESETKRPAPIRSTRSRRTSSVLSKQLRTEIELQRRQINELQRLLDKREAVVAQQSEMLATQTAKSQEMHTAANDYLDLLIALVNESANIVRENEAGNAEASTAEGELPETASEPPTIQSLQEALADAAWELELANEESEVAESNLTSTTALLDATRQIVLQSGEMAVPILVEMLSQDMPELRVWAAGALAQVGADNTMAIDALIIAAEDSDINVKNAAAAAIESLGGS